MGPLEPGEVYPRGSPNAWTIFSADPALGLVYIPTGNAGGDYYGAQRSEAFGRFSESIARTLGTARFLVAQTILVTVWISVNVISYRLRWDPYPDAVGYNVQVIAANNQLVFARGNKGSRVTATTVEVDVDLPPGTYNWAVRADNAAGQVIGCSFLPRRFTVQ